MSLTNAAEEIEMKFTVATAFVLNMVGKRYLFRWDFNNFKHTCDDLNSMEED